MKELNEAEKLCITRLRAKGVPYTDIANRLSVDVKELKQYLKNTNGSK
jgi:DNA-directed RNA polymerase specialized sigma24 family protein